jgi:hypothetical protein
MRHMPPFIILLIVVRIWIQPSILIAAAVLAVLPVLAAWIHLR